MSIKVHTWANSTGQHKVVWDEKRLRNSFPPAPKKKTVKEKKSNPCNFSRDFEIEERWRSSIQETSEIEAQKFQKREMKHHFVMGEIQLRKFQKLNPRNFKSES
jgi:hypothetical protein